MGTQQSKAKPSSASECHERALTLWHSHDPSEHDRKQALELWLHAATELNHVPSALEAAEVLFHGKSNIPRDILRAKQLCEIAAASGDVGAMACLGLLLVVGAEGVERDAVRAKELFEHAASAGDVDAMASLGLLLVDGAEGVERDAVRAKELFEHAASAGDVDAMTSLGRLLVGGAEGVERDAVRAKELYEHAASAGDVDAMTSLGRLLVDGAEGVERDAVRAKELYEHAASAGNPRAMRNLGFLLVYGAEGVERDAVRGKKFYERAANAGNPRAMTNLGFLLVNGAEGVERDAVRAKELYEHAARAGDVYAMTNLGSLLMKGTEGVERDVARAKELYEHASSAGNPRAMTNLGFLLVNGAEGVERDAVRAKELYEHAASAGDVYAMVYLGYLLMKGTEGVERDAVRAKELYEHAASTGNPRAMTNLGFLLVNGAEGVERDAARAKELYEHAASAGDVYAMVYLGYLLMKGAEGVERDAVRAKELYERAASAVGVIAMTELGYELVNGSGGVWQNVALARGLWERAASAGHVPAVTSLGLLFAYGTGLERETVRAKELLESLKELLESAASAGDDTAMTELGLLFENGAEGVERDAVRAKELYESAARTGNVTAMTNLGLLYANGVEGIERDPVRARELWEQAASAGEVAAMTNLGVLLAHSAEGVERDTIRAKELYERAARAGDVTAMTNLGLLFANGAEGIEKDSVRAKELYESAASAGDIRAMTNLGLLFANGAEGVQRDFVRAKELYENAASAGEVRAMTFLGLLLANGAEGIEADPGRARNLLDDATRHSSCEGFLRRARFLSTGDEETPRDVLLASECFEKAVLLAEQPYERGEARTEFARFLLAQEGEAHQSNALRVADLLEEAVKLFPHRETVSELINFYSHTAATHLRSPQRAAELKQIVPEDNYTFFRGGIVRFLEQDGNADRRLTAVMEQALVKPKSCLLLTLGAPGRGKTSTLNSLRGLSFDSQQNSTEMLEMSQFVTEPGVRGLDNRMLDHFDFRENSFRAVVSRISVRDMAKFERRVGGYNVGSAMHLGAKATAAENHRDVLERVRQSLTHVEIGSKRSSRFVRCLDLGGQSEYEMAHSLFLARADILLFVVNLEAVTDSSTREKEIEGLCYWMQLGFIHVGEPSEVRVIIVATHKGLQADCSDSLDLLRTSLSRQLGKDVYDEWVKETHGKLSGMFVAIENSRAVEDPEGSGLENLEAMLRKCLIDVLNSRKSIPLRWLALVDKLRRTQGEKRVLWTKEEVEDICKDFPGFPSDESERNEELLQSLSAMTSLTGVTSTVLFELSNDEWVLSVSPERIVDMFRKVSGPRTWRKFLDQEDVQEVDRSGTLSESTLLTHVWGEYEESEKRKMIELLCQCDLLVRLRDENQRNESKGPLYGVPFLFKKERSFVKLKREDEMSLEVVTEFQDALPNGLQGGLMAYLCRTVHDGLQDVKMVGKNSTLLKLNQGRVFVEFKSAAREILWTCIGQYPVYLAQVCVQKLDSFLNHRAHHVKARRRNVCIRDCEEDGCGETGSIQIDFGIICGREFDSEVCCKECEVPRMVSELYQDLCEIGSTESREQLSQSSTPIPAGLLEEMFARMHSAIYCFQEDAIQEACKGLSRVLELGKNEDIDRFGQQLQTKNPDGYESNYKSCYVEREEGRIPCFAVSYVQHAPKQGRFKFSDQQWHNLRCVLQELWKGGVSRCRLWLDQCLWLRDAPQHSWAQTGVLPYILWPVIALGEKKFGTDRTLPTYDRMWPFVEEVAGLWSLGVITAREWRGPRKEDGCRECVSFNRRRRLEPEESMRLLLLNVYHGATDNLKTGWTSDVQELKKMAKWNLESGTEKLIIGPKWERRTAVEYVSNTPRVRILSDLAMQREDDNQVGCYLEDSRKLQSMRWSGFVEWTSGNGICGDTDELEWQRNDCMRNLTKINVITRSGEFQLLGLERNEDCALWLLVAMNGRSSNFSRGKVSWTKVVHGTSSCILKRSSAPEVVRWVLSQQLKIAEGELNIVSVKDCTSKPIQWI